MAAFFLLFFCETMATVCYLTKLLELAKPRADPPKDRKDPMEYDPENPNADTLDTRPYDPTSPTPPNTPRKDPMAYDPEDPSCDMDLEDGPDYDPESPPIVPRDSHVYSVHYWPTSPAYSPTSPDYGLKELAS